MYNVLSATTRHNVLKDIRHKHRIVYVFMCTHVKLNRVQKAIIPYVIPREISKKYYNLSELYCTSAYKQRLYKQRYK